MSGLGDAELERYARQIVLREFGGVGQNRLKASRVALVGAGGIGSAVVPALAGAGVGTLTIIDDDRVELGNLHRQTLFDEGDIGAPKADRAAAFAAALNRHVDAVPTAVRIGPANADALLGGHDLVIDGSDTFATRLAVGDSCVRLGIPLISAAAVMFQAQVGLFRSRPCYRCWVGDAFDAEDCDTCAEQGVLGALTGVAGNFAALIALRLLAGVGDEQSGTVHLFDGRTLRWRAIAAPPDPDCRTCASG